MTDYPTGDNPRAATLQIAESWARAGFTQIPNAFIERNDLDATAKWVYVVLLSHAWRAGQCFPTLEYFRTVTGACERTVRQAIRELMNAGLVESKRQGLGRPNLYYVRLDATRTEREAVLPRQSLPDDDQDKQSLPGQNGARGRSRTEREAGQERSERPVYIEDLEEYSEEDLRGDVPSPLPPPSLLSSSDDASSGQPSKNPNRYAEVIDGIRAAGIEYAPSQVDAQAVNKTGRQLDPARIAAAYVEAHARASRGEGVWANTLSVQAAIKNINALELKGVPHGTHRNGAGPALRRSAGAARAGEGAAAAADRFAEYGRVPDWARLRPDRNHGAGVQAQGSQS